MPDETNETTPVIGDLNAIDNSNKGRDMPDEFETIRQRQEAINQARERIASLAAMETMLSQQNATIQRLLSIIETLTTTQRV